MHEAKAALLVEGAVSYRGVQGEVVKVVKNSLLELYVIGVTVELVEMQSFSGSSDLLYQSLYFSSLIR